MPDRTAYQSRVPRNSQAKVTRVLFVQARSSPLGCRGKIILARRACGIFPANLACTGHDLSQPVVTGTPAPRSRINKKEIGMLQQMSKEKYSIETLREWNVSYDHEHWLTQEDVDMANSYVQLIERTRSEVTPQIGDRLIYVSRHGDYYGNALIDGADTEQGLLSVCEQPYVPFVWKEEDCIRLSVSGGAFHHINPQEMKFLKWTEGAFKDWGHCGACANGSVTFFAKVPLWFYAEPNPMYGNFTTETYRKFYLNKRKEQEEGNLYHGDGIAFRNEAEFRQFLKDYEGTVFMGNWEKQIVVWCFRREYVFLLSTEWEKIDAPAEERRLNFHPEQVKIIKDMEKHITYFYRIKPQNF